jgi:hypothetical protein
MLTVGLTDRSSAAIPVTCGAAIDVPSRLPYSPPGRLDQT